MRSRVLLNIFDELKSSKPMTPSATPVTMNRPMEVVLIFLLIGQEFWADGGAEASPRVRNCCTAGSVECFSNSRGLPLARMVRVLGSRKTQLSAMVKMLASSWVTTTNVAPRLSRSWRISSSRLRELIGSRPAEGSSKNKKSGSTGGAAPESGALAHAAGNFRRIIVLESLQTNERKLEPGDGAELRRRKIGVFAQDE